MEISFWLKKWETQQIGFHLRYPHPLLKEFWSNLGFGVPSTVFVPLCGKSTDLEYLRSIGHQVVGVEVSESALEQFFLEQSLEFEKTVYPEFICFRGERIELCAGDFFVFDSDYLSEGRIDAVYDRAALVALPKEMRKDYVAKLKTLLRKGARIFLITAEYRESQISPPPFYVDEYEVASLFDHWCERKILASMPAKLKDIDIIERLYLLEVR